MGEKMTTKKITITFFSILIITVIIVLILTSNLQNNEQETIYSADSPQIPRRGFYMGVLPVPRDGQSFEEAYSQAAEYSEFSPVWGRPTPFYDLAEDLSGNWGANIFRTKHSREWDVPNHSCFFYRARFNTCNSA